MYKTIGFINEHKAAQINEKHLFGKYTDNQVLKIAAMAIANKTHVGTSNNSDYSSTFPPAKVVMGTVGNTRIIVVLDARFETEARIITMYVCYDFDNKVRRFNMTAV